MCGLLWGVFVVSSAAEDVLNGECSVHYFQSANYWRCQGGAQPQN